MNTFIQNRIEKYLNQYLALDPESATRLKKLAGKRISLDLRIFSASFVLFIDNEKIRLEQQNEATPDVMIKGTPLSLLQVSLNKENRKKLFKEDVMIEGNLELGQQVIDLFDDMEIDWEEHLSKWVGDIPAHHIGEFARGIKRVVSRVSESLQQNINEYVHEEIPLFPGKEELQDFFRDIDELRMDADRLEARLLSSRGAKRRGISIDDRGDKP